MASRRRRSRKGRVTRVKLSQRKRHGGAKYKCKHPRSHKMTYHRKKSAANRACGKGR